MLCSVCVSEVVFAVNVFFELLVHVLKILMAAHSSDTWWIGVLLEGIGAGPLSSWKADVATCS